MTLLENTLTTLIKYKEACMYYNAAQRAQYKAQAYCQNNIRGLWFKDDLDKANIHLKGARMEADIAYLNLMMCGEGISGFNTKLSRLLPHDLATMQSWTLKEFEEIYKKPKTK